MCEHFRELFFKVLYSKLETNAIDPTYKIQVFLVYFLFPPILPLFLLFSQPALKTTFLQALLFKKNILREAKTICPCTIYLGPQ